MRSATARAPRRTSGAPRSRSHARRRSRRCSRCEAAVCGAVKQGAHTTGRSPAFKSVHEHLAGADAHLLPAVAVAQGLVSLVLGGPSLALMGRSRSGGAWWWGRRSPCWRQRPAVASWWRCSLVSLWLISTNRLGSDCLSAAVVERVDLPVVFCVPEHRLDRCLSLAGEFFAEFGGGRCPASARAALDRAAAGVVDPAGAHPRPAGQGPHAASALEISGPSGNSGCGRCSTTTGSASDASWCTDSGGASLASPAPLPARAREQVTVALEIIDALDRQLPRLIASCERTGADSQAAGR